MITIEELKANGKQIQENENHGTFTINVLSPYFKKEVRLNFLNQKNVKGEHELLRLVKYHNEFIQLNESKIGWIKEIIWKDYLYSLEGTDYGFDPIPKSVQLDNVTLDQITILKEMPTANLDNIKKNINYFKIFNKEEALFSLKINHIDIIEHAVTFYISTLWDEEHDIVIYTDNYILRDVAY